MEPSAGQGAIGVSTTRQGNSAVLTVTGLVDEHFPGFGDLAGITCLVIDTSRLTSMTSFGLRNWLRAMEQVSRTIDDVYLLGCPTFFVDQLNMVLNFGGKAKVITVMAPRTCAACGTECFELIDVLAERVALAKGQVPEQACRACGGRLELDEIASSYFAFLARYPATGLSPAAAELLASTGLYTPSEVAAEKPARIVKLVHGAVTYFRIAGVLGSTFRARPILVGAEGEVVLDLEDVDRFDPACLGEWQSLLRSLSRQVPAVTLVDISPAFLTNAGDSVRNARNVAVASVVVPYVCVECKRQSGKSMTLQGAAKPLAPARQVCASCGGEARSELTDALAADLQHISTAVPEQSAKLIAQRHEVLSRALTDANVAQARDAAAAALPTDHIVLGKYRIVRRLSAGGMAEVFLAMQVGIGGFEKPVALKRIQRQLLESRHRAIDMFLNEAKIAGRLMHPNIVQVFDVGEVGGALYLAMEYVHGKDLRELSKQLRAIGKRIPVGDACFVVREVAQALHHAYWSTDIDGKQMRVVHRDVSPHNIIMSYAGSVKLLDFGVAMSSVTEQEDSMIVGKWQYMSPEHTFNQPLDHRSDLFALGVVLYLLLTGQLPFVAKEPRAIVAAIRAGEFRPVSEHVPEIPPQLAKLVARLLAVEPDARPQTGREVVDQLDAIVRAHELECSATSLARFLASMFEGTNAPQSVLELVRHTVELETADTKQIALGSGPTQAQEHPDQAPASNPGSFRPNTDSDSASINARFTPTSGVSEVSQSLVRRLDEEPSNVVHVPSQRLRVWNILVAIAIMLCAAVAAFLIVQSL